MPQALRSAMPRLTAMSRRRTHGSCAMHSSTRAWLVRKVQLATISMLPNYGNRLLVFRCERRVQDTHRPSAAGGGQLPGATGGAHAPGPVIRAVLMALAVLLTRLRPSVPTRAPGQIPGLAAAGSSDTKQPSSASRARPSPAAAVVAGRGRHAEPSTRLARHDRGHPAGPRQGP